MFDFAGEGANELIQMGSILVQSKSSLEEVCEDFQLVLGCFTFALSLVPHLNEVPHRSFANIVSCK